MLRDKITFGKFTADSEETDMVKIPESELNDITKTAFVAGMLSGSAVTAVLIIVVELIKMAIFS